MCVYVCVRVRVCVCVRVQMLSTGVITHGFLHFGERWCNWWISRDQANPLNDKDKAKEQADKTAQKKKKNKDG